MNKPVAWIDPKELDMAVSTTVTKNKQFDSNIPLYTHPVKELTREDRLKLIGTLKWAEDLLREAGHAEASSDAQDCIMLLRKAQEK